MKIMAWLCDQIVALWSFAILSLLLTKHVRHFEINSLKVFQSKCRMAPVFTHTVVCTHALYDLSVIHTVGGYF